MFLDHLCLIFVAYEGLDRSYKDEAGTSGIKHYSRFAGLASLRFRNSVKALTRYGNFTSVLSFKKS